MQSNNINRQIILVSRPIGMPSESNFSIRESSIPKPKDGEVLVKAHYITVDPYMRGRMIDRKSYVPPFQLNEPIIGGVVGEVIESKDNSIKPGEFVYGFLNWADYSIGQAQGLQKLDPSLAPISTSLGVLGMPGLSAYFGFLAICDPKKGDTVVVTSAAGAVGLVVGQIAKIKECRVVGIVSSDEKARVLLNEFGFDAAVNYKDPNFVEELKKACPNGVDIYFDNVGGEITDRVFELLNKYSRISVCGQISAYNLDKPDIGPRLLTTLLMKSAMAKGFIISDFAEKFPEGKKQMAEWFKQGKIKNKETVVNGLENAPKAFIGLFKGENIGKQIVKV